VVNYYRSSNKNSSTHNKYDFSKNLAPEAFGVVATVTMIITFADMFMDAGFQKYLVQHEFKDDDEKFKYTDVAFWTNLTISLLLWGFILVFSGNIANMVGNPGLGHVIIIACIQLPLTSVFKYSNGSLQKRF
jgi:O-antigen/teichoic acid export membrane protein